MTAVSEIRTKIWNLIKNRPAVSFVEISEIDGFMGGNRFIDTPDLRKFNIVMWNGVSDGGFEAFSELMGQDMLEFDSCSPSLYMNRGVSPELNVAVRKRVYINTRWIPVLISRAR